LLGLGLIDRLQIELDGELLGGRDGQTEPEVTGGVGEGIAFLGLLELMAMELECAT
jgi:hypothetical protein